MGMRAFFAAERQLIDRLLTSCAGLSVSTDAFWASEFFNTQTERALILQPQGAFGYFYLKVNAFDDPSRRQAELRALIDLLTLWAMLREQGLIVVTHDEPQQGHVLHFVGELFENPHACPAHLALNSQGDFSFHPNVIQDTDNNVIYKGMHLTGDLYRLVHSQVGGTVYPSRRLVDLAVVWKTAPKSGVTPGRPVAPTARQRSGPTDAPTGGCHREREGARLHSSRACCWCRHWRSPSWRSVGGRGMACTLAQSRCPSNGRSIRYLDPTPRRGYSLGSRRWPPPAIHPGHLNPHRASARPPPPRHNRPTCKALIYRNGMRSTSMQLWPQTLFRSSFFARPMACKRTPASTMAGAA